jgi:hypothetical protein
VERRRTNPAGWYTHWYGTSILIETTRVSRRERHAGGWFAIDRDLERIEPGVRERDIEHQHGAGFHVGDARRGFAKLYRAVAAEQLGPVLVDEANADAMQPDLGAPPSYPEHEMGAWVHRGERAHPHMLEDAKDGELTLLVDQGVVSEDGEVDVQFSSPESS